MAKSARASVKKSNKTKLRRSVFGPIEEARTARLSQKLQELAAQPKPESEKLEMDVDTNKESSDTSGASNQPASSLDGNTSCPFHILMVTDSDSSVDMDLDYTGSSKSASRRAKSKKSGHRVQKRHRKVQNAMTFPAVKQRRTVSRVVKRK